MTDGDRGPDEPSAGPRAPDEGPGDPPTGDPDQPPGPGHREAPSRDAAFEHAELREPVEAADPRPATIERFEVRDERTVRAYWWGGVEPCHVLADIDVTEADDEVRVRLLVGRDAAADDDVVCVMIALLLAVDIGLERDLGDRALIDAGDPAQERRPDVAR